MNMLCALESIIQKAACTAIHAWGQKLGVDGDTMSYLMFSQFHT